MLTLPYLKRIPIGALYRLQKLLRKIKFSIIFAHLNWHQPYRK